MCAIALQHVKGQADKQWPYDSCCSLTSQGRRLVDGNMHEFLELGV